jgi:hypothetical protein
MARLILEHAPHCIAFGGLRVDDAIENALLTVVGPGAIAAATAAGKEAGQRRDQVREALGRDLEAARYAADRAFWQYDAADPANRLVAGELEARWNRALTHVAEVEAKIAAHDAAMPVAAVDPLSLGLLASNLKTVWSAPTTDARLSASSVGDHTDARLHSEDAMQGTASFDNRPSTAASPGPIWTRPT